jgi:hypothetical protein
MKSFIKVCSAGINPKSSKPVAQKTGPPNGIRRCHFPSVGMVAAGMAVVGMADGIANAKGGHFPLFLLQVNKICPMIEMARLS